MRECTGSQPPLHPRIHRELKTVNAMITLYCRDKHGTPDRLCRQCQGVAEYAEKRLRCCPFHADKPTCGTCSIHCYRPDMKQQIQSIMRYSGPRMLLRHPILAIAHLLDGKLIKPPRLKPAQTNSRPTGHSGDNRR